MPKKRLIFSTFLIGFLSLGTTLLCLIGPCPRVGSLREEDLRATDYYNLRRIAIALQVYASRNDNILPPQHVTDAAGKPLYSWRVLILPYLDQDDIYQEFHLNEPWNSPHNQRVSETRIREFQLVNETHSAPSITNYVVVHGPGTIFPRQGTVQFDEIKDGMSNTILVVSLAKSDIHWAEPRDLDIETMSFQINDPNKPSISRTGSKGAFVGFVDAQVQFITDDTPPEAVRAALTINGGEKVELP